MIEIDGSMGEGGGQILRTSLTLAALKGEEMRIYNIRARRSNPGLRPQHLTAVKAVAEICNGRVKNARIGSTELTFTPGSIGGGMYRFDVGTAGSITLVLQTILPILLVAEKETTVYVFGGTDVKWAPQINYFSDVFLEILRIMGAKISLNIKRRGYYPEGGGEVRLTVKPSSLSGINISTKVGKPEFGGIVHMQNLPNHVAERMVNTAAKCLGISPAGISVDVRKGRSMGAGIVLWCKYANTILGADYLGERGLPAEKVAENCCSLLLQEFRSGASVDVHMSDQLMVYGALSPEIVYTARELTDHAKTNAQVLKMFGVNVSVEKIDKLYRFRVGKI